jgi:Fibronectin type III domain
VSVIVAAPGSATQAQIGFGGSATWSNPTNIEGSSSNATVTPAGSAKSKDIDGYNFNLGIPGGATLNGLAVSCTAQATAGGVTFPTQSCEIALNGTNGTPATGENGVTIATSSTGYNWGGSTDTWSLGAALTVANLNTNTTSGPVVGIVVEAGLTSGHVIDLNNVQLSVYYTSTTVPGSPTGVTITSDGTNPNTAIDISWTAPASNGGASITDYKLQWTDDGLTINTVDLGSTSTSYVFSGLSMGQLYGLQIAAVNSVGTGGYSGEWSYGTPAGEVYVVSQTSDEVWQNTSGTVANGPTPSITVSANEYIAWRFQSIAAVQGASAAKAYLILSSVAGSTIAGTAWCEAADNASTFTTSTSEITSLTKTSDSAPFGTIGTWTPIDVHAPVQDVFNRSGWATGHALAFILECTSGSTSIYDYANGGGDQPFLLIVPGTAVSKSATLPVEPKASIAGSPTTPVETTASLAASQTIPLETKASLATAPTVPLDAAAGVQASSTLPLEPLAAIALAPAEPADWLGTLGPTPALPIETRANLAASVTPPIFWSQGVVMVAPLTPLDWLATVALSPLLPTEWMQTTTPVSLSFPVPLEWLLSASNGQTAPTLPVEWLGVGMVRLQAVSPIEWRAALAAITKTLPIETCLSVRPAPLCPVEWGGSTTNLSGSFFLPLDFLAQLARSPALPLESRLQLTRSATLPLEPLAGLALAPALPLDALASMTVKPFAPVEWSNQVVLARLLPANWLLPLAIANGLPLETRAALALSQALPIDSRTSLASSLLLPLETVAQLARASALPLDTHTQLGSAVSLPMETRMQLAAAQNLPLDSAAGVALKPTSPLEWLGTGKSIVSAAQVPIGWRAALAGLSGLPIESPASLATAATLPIETRLQLGLVVSLPTETRLQLAAAEEMPVRWYLNLPAVAISVPLEVLRGVAAAGAAFPVEWFADAQPDYSGGVFRLPRRGRVFCLDARGTVFVLGKRGTVFKLG